MNVGCLRRFFFRKRSLVLFCVLVIVSLVVLDGRDRCFGFELEIFGRVPDLNQHAVVYAKIRHSPEPCGYILYHDAMRESGINSLILTDKLLCYYASEFFGEWRSVSGESSDGDVGWFGRLPSVEFPGQSELVRVAEGMQPVRDALAAIDTNAVFLCRDSLGKMTERTVYDYVHWSTGIGIPWESDRRRDVLETKEALTACAIGMAFPDVKMPKIEELRPVEDRIWMMHGRAPVPVRVNVEAERIFDFYSANGELYARLRVKPAYSRLSYGELDWNLKKYQAIFRLVFSELKSCGERRTLRGRSYYDTVTQTGVIRNLKRED